MVYLGQSDTIGCMDTYTPAKSFVAHPEFQSERLAALDGLDITLVDPQLAPLIKNLNRLPYLFTLQCCHGHLFTLDSKEIADFEGYKGSDEVEYRLAYIAFCIENSPLGRSFLEELKQIPSRLEEHTVHFGSAQWFWDHWVNSYILQVMPLRFKDQDKAVIDLPEAGRIIELRDTFFSNMRDLAASLVQQKHDTSII